MATSYVIGPFQYSVRFVPISGEILDLPAEFLVPKQTANKQLEIKAVNFATLTDYCDNVTIDRIEGFRLFESLDDLFTVLHEGLYVMSTQDEETKNGDLAIEYVPSADAIRLTVNLRFRSICESFDLVLQSVTDLCDKTVLLNKINYLTTRVETLEKDNTCMRALRDAAPSIEGRLARMELMLGWASIHTFGVQVRYDDTRYLRSYKRADTANNNHHLMLYEQYSDAWVPAQSSGNINIAGWVEQHPHITDEHCSSIYLLFRNLEVVTIEDRPWFDLGLLRSSPGIIKLTLVNLEKLKTVDLITGLGQLKFLTIVNCRAICDLRALLDCASLELLTVDRVTNVGVFENEHMFVIEYNA